MERSRTLSWKNVLLAGLCLVLIYDFISVGRQSLSGPGTSTWEPELNREERNTELATSVPSASVVVQWTESPRRPGLSSEPIIPHTGSSSAELASYAQSSSVPPITSYSMLPSSPLGASMSSTAAREPAKATPPATNPYIGNFLQRLRQNYTKTLVIAKKRDEDASWIDKDLGDLLDADLLSTAIYIVDDDTAPLHPPLNKGHEAMVYLSYIIDHYNELPDISLFMHSHSATWHNNDLLDGLSSRIVRHLSAEKVIREGYVNLRCHWEPGCPAHIQLALGTEDINKKEQQYMAAAFAELFPGAIVPEVLAQPCCAQFAVSRSAIHRHPVETYVRQRDWLTRTELDSYTSGRIFEYIWQYLFTSSPVVCPDVEMCYCDTFSVCFPTSRAFMQYMDISDTFRAFRDELGDWRKQDEEFKKASQGGGSTDGEVGRPQHGRDEWLEWEVDSLSGELERRKRAAIELGSDPVRKQDVLKAVWDELVAHPKGNG